MPSSYVQTVTGLLLICLSLTHLTHGQNRIGTGKILETYQKHCMVCHGKNFNQGLGGSLLEEWTIVSKKRSVESIIHGGIPEMNMPSFKEILSPEQIRALSVLIDEKRQQEQYKKIKKTESPDTVFTTQHHAFKLEKICPSEESIFWAIDFLPQDRILLTQKNGKLRIFDKKSATLGQPIPGTPEVWDHGQGGLLDVGVHPDYAKNGWIYLSFAKKLKSNGKKGEGFTTVVRGRIQNGRWVDETTLFEVDPKFASGAGVHFGSRFVFQNGYVFFGIGDRGRQNQAQDLETPNGAIHRIHEDGRIPKDNPFLNTPKAYPTLWTYGNRNPQGLTIHPETQVIWESEHGPRGGDEVNIIQKGINYGWPTVTYGINYSGTPITSETQRKGIQDPATYFTPSIAICGIDFYEGSRFPEWNHHLFVGGLASQELWRMVTNENQITEQELILKNQGRIRDVAAGPDGFLYLVLNQGRRQGPGGLFRLIPSEKP